MFLKRLFPRRLFPSFKAFSFRHSSSATSVDAIKNSAELDAVKEALKNASPSATPKMLIGFTCKCCSARTHRTMSRHAYEKGIVLIECSGCQKKHLIADNLGWFKDTPQAARRIEDMTDVGEIRRELKLSETDASDLLEILSEK